MMLLGATLLAACATSSELTGAPEGSGGAETVAAPKEQLVLSGASPGVETSGLVNDAVSPAECVDFAKKVRLRSASDGWHLLNECVLRAKFPRGAFIDMGLLLDGTWDKDFVTRPDALDLISKFIAFRGGDVATDLKAFQARRVPLFSLSAAVTQPDIFQGRMVLVRAQYDKTRMASRAVTAQLSETALVQRGQDTQTRGYRYHGRYTATTNANARDSYYGNSNSTGTTSYSNDSTWSYYDYQNVSELTGVKVLGKLPQADPFLEPGQEYIFLARFEGLRAAPHEKGADEDDDDDAPKDNVALITILRYYAPHAAPVK